MVAATCIAATVVLTLVSIHGVAAAAGLNPRHGSAPPFAGGQQRRWADNAYDGEGVDPFEEATTTFDADMVPGAYRSGGW